MAAFEFNRRYDMAHSTRNEEVDKRKQSSEPGSSHGKNSASVTPKDVPPDTAASQDVTERKIASDDVDEQVEELLDDAVEMTFPASDPIAIPDPSKLEKDREHKRP